MVLPVEVDAVDDFEEEFEVVDFEDDEDVVEVDAGFDEVDDVDDAVVPAKAGTVRAQKARAEMNGTRMEIPGER